jgi:hypothetical protein
MTPQQRYEDYLLKKKFANSGVEDLSGDIPESAKETNWLGQSNLTQNSKVQAPTGEMVDLNTTPASEGMGATGQGAVKAAQTAIDGGSPLDAAGAGMTTAGMSTANPYLIGAGLGVQSLSAIQKGKNARAKQEYEAEVQKYNARQQAIARMTQIGQGLKA